MSSLHLVSDHLWQSTLFAAVVAVVVAMLRGKRASVRHALWLAASIKFVVPFAALTVFGAFIGSRLSLHVPEPAPDFVQTMTSAPFVPQIAPALSIVPSSTATAPSSVLLPALIAIWSAGCLIVLAAWAVRWTRAYRVARSATSYDTGREVAILRRVEASGGSLSPVARSLRRGGSLGRPRPLAMRLSDATIEPGVFGIWRPVLLWPRAMSAHLSDDQIETIFIHELSHVRRRDNLAAAAHLLVQAICWFHPLVWWIGARLIDERERACDEDVVRAGRDRRGYAESLLKTCQLSVGAPPAFTAGVTGSDLKRRLTTIMAAPIGARLGIVARIAFALAMATIVAVPVINGAAGVPQISSTITLPDPSKTFEAASVRQNMSGDPGSSCCFGDSHHVTARNASVRALLMQAFPIQSMQFAGGPGWLDTDRFDIVAKAGAEIPDGDVKVMLQNLLIERFSIKLHVETRNLPIYALVVARADGQLGADLHIAPCESSSNDQPCDEHVVPGGLNRAGREEMLARLAGGISRGGSGVSTTRAHGTMRLLASMLSGVAGRLVIDRTNLDGRFDWTLRYMRPGEMTTDATQRAPDLFTALQEQLGLKLEATRGPVEVLVIDSAQHPKNDDFEMPAQ
ncbi:MAG TPA: M56 family metallopeptidase [Vicinamibacterales bacterium]|nr:M56 family metallopeptidase [Vicinamibacterales bacterium]